jgi:hypothetical protein
MGSAWQDTEDLGMGEVLDDEGLERLSRLTGGIGRADEVCIGGVCATCDPYPQEVKISTAQTYCHTAAGWAEVFQVFEDVRDSAGNTIRYNMLINIDLEQGQKKCVTIPPDKHYVFHWYVCTPGSGATCTDNEDPTDYKVKGVVQGVDNDGNMYREEDVCSGSDTLTERWCEGGGPNSQTISCGGRFGSNYICENGACKKEGVDPQCTDTCASLGYDCGWAEVCGKSIYCQSCSPGLTCENNKCVGAECTDTYASLGYECGEHLVCGQLVQGPECPSGTVELKVKSFKKVSDNKYEVTVSIFNDYKNKIIGMIAVEMKTQDEYSREITLEEISFKDQVTCGRAEDQHLWVVVKPGDTVTKTVTTNMPSGTYKAVEVLGMPGCHTERPWSKDASDMFFDYNIFAETGSGKYSYEDLVPVSYPSQNVKVFDPVWVVTKGATCASENNYCWKDSTGKSLQQGDSVCDPDGKDTSKRYECVFKPETGKCEMDIIGCPLDGDSSDQVICREDWVTPNNAVCDDDELNEQVCVRKKTTIGADATEMKEAVEGYDTIGWFLQTFNDVADKAETTLGMLTCLFIKDCPWEGMADKVKIDEEMVEDVLTIASYEEVFDDLKDSELHATAWTTRATYEYLNKFNQFEIIPLTEQECLAKEKEVKDAWEGAQSKIAGDESVIKAGLTPSADPSKLKKMTTGDKLKYSCYLTADCEGDDSSCYNLNEIVEKGWLTEKDADVYLEELEQKMPEFSWTTAGTVAALGTAFCYVAVVGTSAITAGASLPALGLCAVGAGGTIIGVSAGIKSWAKGVEEKNKDAVGLCIDESEVGAAGFIKKIKEQIAKALGKDVNDPWVNYVFIGLVLLLFILLYLMFSPPKPKYGVR